jgi:hypothetical protein
MTSLQSALQLLRNERGQKTSDLQQLDTAISAVQLLTRAGTNSPKRRAGAKRRNISAAARRRIAAAQKARWAKFRAQKRRHRLGSRQK